jgi:tRNA U34 2-thiouridine synthase MnmA/TrmU
MKALCVFSGGLDSMLAAELIRAQGIDVLALFFETPFFTSEKAGKSARKIGLSFKVVNIAKRHLEIVKHPRHGYGNNMNPCIDCHALMFRIAGEMLEQEGAGFVFSGEVLGQRPMSQNKRSLSLIALESGLEGLLLRPLSAKSLPPTIPEEKGWVIRDLLMDFQGRSRKPQIELAKKLDISEYPSPAGGCLLTENAFSLRLKDLLSARHDFELREIEFLKLGRHFRLDMQTKAIVGRNKQENEALAALANNRDIILVSMSVPGPTVLVSGDYSNESLEMAAEITVAYSDAKVGENISVRVTGGLGGEISATGVRDKAEFRSYMI